MRQLYLAVALHKITYGINIWYTPPEKPTRSKKSTGSVSTLCSLQKTQRIATLAITGTLRPTPNDFIDIYAGIFPMKLALLRACHNSLLRMLTLPDYHPLHWIIQDTKCSPPVKHHSPIDLLIKWFGLGNTKIEMISPIASLTYPTTKYTTTIAPSRKESIESEKSNKADFKIFSDGSGHKNGIGTAAILYKKGRLSGIKTLQAYIGTPDKHNTYEAEILGPILVLWILYNSPETLGKMVSLYTDNQSIIDALSSHKLAPGQYLINNLRTAANATMCKLEIKWISDHSKVKGNEAADNLAKEAALGRLSALANLPHILRNPLLFSVSALKQNYTSELKTQWSRLWDASPWKAKIKQLGDKFPFSKHHKMLHTLTRKQSSLILQLKCAHFPLNVYLHRINKSDTDRCQAYAKDQTPSPIKLPHPGKQSTTTYSNA